MHLIIVTSDLLRASPFVHSLKRHNFNCLTASPLSFQRQWLPESDAFIFPHRVSHKEWELMAQVFKDLNKKLPLIFLGLSQKELFTKNHKDLLKQSIFLDDTLSLNELMMMVKELVRKHQGYNSELQLGDLKIDRIHRVLKREEESIYLSKKEFFLLELLALNVGRITTRETIIDYVWDKREFISQNTIDVTVSRLRRKLCPKDPHSLIRTIPCLGYKLELESK